jgi:N-acetylglucosamine malate deacetylase 1
MTSVLALAPHPDDDVIGCGGSLAKHAAAGADIMSVTVIGRERSMHDEHMTDEEFREEATAACQELGVQRSIWLDEPSRDLVLSRRLHLRLVSIVREVAPDILYLPHRKDDDVEHRMVHILGTESLWMAASDFFPECGAPVPAPKLILGYEVWSPLERFQYTENIDDTIEHKLAALRCYSSQLKHAQWDEAARGLASYRGALTSGFGYAEVFDIIHYSGTLER